MQDSVLPWGCGGEASPHFSSPPLSSYSILLTSHISFPILLLTPLSLLLSFPPYSSLLTPLPLLLPFSLLSSYSTLRTPHFSLSLLGSLCLSYKNKAAHGIVCRLC